MTIAKILAMSMPVQDLTHLANKSLVETGKSLTIDVEVIAEMVMKKMSVSRMPKRLPKMPKQELRVY